MAKTALLLDLTVNRMLPAPQRAMVGIGLFRVACPESASGKVADTSLTIPYGSNVVVSACDTLVIRTDKPLTVTLTSGGVDSILKVTQLLAITTQIDQARVAYDEPGGLGNATVTIIQA
jgi:hypothetical protein